MSKYIKVKPTLFFVFFVIAVIVLIYAFTATLNTADGDHSGSGAISAGQESELTSEEQKSGGEEEELSTLFVQEGSEEESSKLLTRENNDFYAASRGDIDRYSNSKQADPAPVKAAGSAAPSASAETKAAPAAAQAEPSAVTPAPTPQPETKETAEAENTPAIQSAPAAPAKPAETVKPAAASATAPAAESGDLDLLARLITAEAQGEPYEAQVAVGAVVMNRVKSGDWPNSIQGVIYQKIGEYYQFTPVVNGWIDKPAQPEAIEAAKAALNGSDPTGGAQFYYDDKCTNEWILDKPVSLRVGHMIFAY